MAYDKRDYMYEDDLVAEDEDEILAEEDPDSATRNFTKHRKVPSSKTEELFDHLRDYSERNHLNLFENLTAYNLARFLEQYDPDSFELVPEE